LISNLGAGAENGSTEAMNPVFTLSTAKWLMKSDLTGSGPAGRMIRPRRSGVDLSGKRSVITGGLSQRLGLFTVLVLCCVPLEAVEFELVIGQELLIDQERPGRESPPWETWIERSLGPVTAIGGGLVTDRLRLVLSADWGRRPVGFGYVRRGDPVEVHLRVHPRSTLGELLDDWRSYHELAHLLVPFAGNRDIWFAEGLASYYQYLLQARAGVIDADEALVRLGQGIQRGRGDPAGRGRTLRELAPQMWRERAFRRVYWTGAAYFLRVDVGLRQASNHRHSLDSALAGFQRCCLGRHDRWSAKRLIQALGEASIATIWNEEYRRMIDAPAVPEVDSALDWLGASLSSDGMTLLPSAEHARRRSLLVLGDGPRSLSSNSSPDEGRQNGHSDRLD